MRELRVLLVRELPPADLKTVAEILQECGMRNRNVRTLRRALVHSMAVVVAKEGDRVVGFGRMVGDHAYYAALWDIAVTPARQNAGIGRQIVAKLLSVGYKKKLIMLGLFANTPNRAFYRRQGFELLSGVGAMTTDLRKYAHGLRVVRTAKRSKAQPKQGATKASARASRLRRASQGPSARDAMIQ